jgi:primary-amine oxidase
VESYRRTAFDSGEWGLGNMVTSLELGCDCLDSDTGAQTRQMRRMVIWVHTTVANDEYLIYWRFYTDGNVECEVRATGLMVTTPLAEADDRSAYGTVVDDRTYAPFHQHFIVAKLDLDIDGAENTVLEVDSTAAPIGPDNRTDWP